MQKLSQTEELARELAAHARRHRVTPEQISQIYARMARDGDRGSGIGLALIARLSEHLGWRLEIGPGAEGHGTRVRLDLSGSKPA